MHPTDAAYRFTGRNGARWAYHRDDPAAGEPTVSTTGISSIGDDPALPRCMGELFDLDLHHEDDLGRIAVAGLSVRAFNAFAQRLPLPKRLLRSVLHRQRRGTGLRLSPIETEVLLRIARSYARARIALSDDARAFAWFTTSAGYLEGFAAISPLELSMTETGARLVESRLRAHAAASTRAEAAQALSPAVRVAARGALTASRREDAGTGPAARL